MLNPVARNKKTFVSAVIGMALLGLAGCSSDGEEAIEPNPLPDFNQEVKVHKVWDKGVGSGQKDSWLHLTPVVSGDRIFAASASGRVTALSSATGKEKWEVDLETRITGGVGAGEGLVLVGTRDGQVIALSERDGKQLWKAPVTSEVLAAPQVERGVVIVQAIDAKLIGLDAKDGEKLWQQEVLQPVLTLRGTSTPRISDGVVYAGFSNGEARAYRLDTGIQLWDAKVSVPRGSSELERMVDVDAEPLISSDRLYMVSYQGNVVGLDRDSGRVLWARESSSYESMTEGFGNLYLSDAGSVVSAVDQRTGSIVWSQKDFAHRSLSGPAAFGSYVVAGDFEGYLHVISQVDGRIVGRTKVDSSGIRSRPVVVDDMIYVYTNGGDLTALTIK
ncbi:outer membrane protein assembly factor BamB [Parendozoicomonas sp. Alg238-R29]|uniref:outer membrane protein assembly factor BamB n=1 Tax=Parendozoicomonas sp. Alg238-R29 TaxID=2993446 RepID=UPI00248EF09F|nr:outer membrane protein assembly factor BamB [Parendozoicomonas sp. Alg238-R29]